MIPLAIGIFPALFALPVNQLFLRDLCVKRFCALESFRARVHPCFPSAPETVLSCTTATHVSAWPVVSAWP